MAYNFPSGLFISAPTVNISVGCGSSYLTWASISSLTKDLVAWYYVHDTNNAKNAIFNNIEAGNNTLRVFLLQRRL